MHKKTNSRRARRKAGNVVLELTKLQDLKLPKYLIRLDDYTLSSARFCKWSSWLKENYILDSEKPWFAC